MNGVIYVVEMQGAGVVYVGQTRQNPRARWRQHARGRTRLSQMLRLFGADDYFTFSVLEELPGPLLDQRERHWIAHFGTLSPGGLNLTPGGSNNSHRPEAIAKMAAAMRARCAEPEYKAKVSEIRKRLWADPDYREKATRRGKVAKATQGYKAKMSALKKDMWADDQRRSRVSEKAKAQWANPEKRRQMGAAISAAKRAQMADPERSEAVRAKLRAAWERRKARANQM